MVRIWRPIIISRIVQDRLLGVVVMAAAKASRHDPRFLYIRMTIPVGSMLHSGLSGDGASAGAAWAVAVTSALPGDALRADVCLSGAIE